MLVLDVEVVGNNTVDAAAASRVMAAAAAEVPGYTVLSTADLRAMVNLEVDRQNAGCTTNSCLTELADAMGAGLVLFGSVSTLGDTTTTTVSLYASATQALQKRSFTSSTQGLAAPLRAETITLLTGREPRSPVLLATGLVVTAVGAAAAGVGAWQVGTASVENKDVWVIVGRAGLIVGGIGAVAGVIGAVTYFGE